MNRRIFANLILYDIRKGFRENKIKWLVGVFIFVFFSFITVSNFEVNSPELGFLAYFTNILQGMPPYIKTDDSVFTIPVSWFLFYAFLFFVVGFYPSSDLYGAAYYQCFCRCDRWIYCFNSLSCGVCLLGESVSYGQLSYDHQKQQNLCARNGCGCRNNKLHYCDGGFCCARKCVF